jgi:hypothetical protein
MPLFRYTAEGHLTGTSCDLGREKRGECTGSGSEGTLVQKKEPPGSGNWQTGRLE